MTIEYTQRNQASLKLFIFDMDGTLVDSFLNFDQMRLDLGFPKGAPILEYIEEKRNEFSDKEIENFFSIIHKHELEGALKSELMPGIEEFLSFLKEKGIKTAVLTRNSAFVTEETFKKWNLNFDLVLTRDCITLQKPDPYGLLKICKELGAEYFEAVYIGDYEFDLAAAHNAMMPAILFDREGGKDLPFAHKADLVVTDYIDLINNFEEKFLLPLGFKGEQGQ